METAFDILFALSAFIISLVGIYIFIRHKGIGIWREDINKPHKRKVITGGGIPVLFALISTYIFAAILMPSYAFSILGVVIATLIGLSIGLLDEVKDIKIWKKVPLMLIPPLPMAIMALIQPLWGHTTILWIDFGILYWLLVVPIAYMGFSNGANIIAGYDGLEGGIYIIILIVYVLIGIILGNDLVLMISIPLLFAILAFEIFNLPPSKVLLGNVGSFPIGGLLGIIPLIGHFEIILPIVFLPHLIEFGFKIKYKGHTSVFGIVDKNGILRNKDSIKSIIHWIISWGNMTEKKVTMAMLGIESLLCAIAFFVWYFIYFMF